MLGLKNQEEWQRYARGDFSQKGKRPFNIPSSPYSYYKSCGWIDWAHWLGTDNLPHNAMHFPPYEEARKIIHSLKFKNRQEWNIFRKALIRGGKYYKIISRNPAAYYNNRGWRGWEDWLGIKEDRFLSYEQAKKAISKLGLKTWENWRRFDKRKLPDKVPRNPNSVYKRRGTWVSWGDFLGTGNISVRLKINQRKQKRADRFVSYKK
jgi:hypothetical protein